MVSTKNLFALVFVAFFGALLGGCGGGDSSTASTSSSAAKDNTPSAAAPATPAAPAPAPANPPAASTTANVTWTPTAEDPGATAQLAGYHIYYGTSADSMTQVVDVEGAGATSYAIANLPPGTYYFGVASYDTDKIESSLSDVVSVDL
jgi:hypothetical protein